MEGCGIDCESAMKTPSKDDASTRQSLLLYSIWVLQSANGNPTRKRGAEFRHAIPRSRFGFPIMHSLARAFFWKVATVATQNFNLVITCDRIRTNAKLET